MELYFQNARRSLVSSSACLDIFVFVLAYPGFQDLSLRKVAILQAD